MPYDIFGVAPEFKGQFERATREGAPSNYIMPSVIVENDQGNKIVQDIPSRLYEDNIIKVAGEVRHEMAEAIKDQILWKIAELKDLPEGEPKKKIILQVNSPGGVITEGMQIVDAMMFAQDEGIIVETVCTGMAASMGSVILAAGTPGHRSVWPDAEVMLHMASGGAQGAYKDAEIQAKELKYINHRLQAFFRVHTALGHDEKRLQVIFDRDSWMRGEEAMAYGIVDRVDYSQTNPEWAAMQKSENNRHWRINEEMLAERHTSDSYKPEEGPVDPPELTPL